MKKANSTRSALKIFPIRPYVHTGAHNWHGKDICISNAEIFYVLEGGIIFRLNNTTFLLPKHHLLCIPAGSTYTCWKLPGASLNYFDFYFKSEWNHQEFFSQFDLTKPLMTEVPHDTVLELYNTMQYFSAENIPQKLCTCTQLSKFLLLVLTSRLRAEQTKKQFGDILNFMQSHLSEQITLSMLARFKDISPSYFSEKFKEISGFSHAHYLKKLRMEHAATLLKEKKATPQEVAQAVGFSDIYYFKRIFYDFFGIHPEKFADIFIEPSYVNTQKAGKEDTHAKS